MRMTLHKILELCVLAGVLWAGSAFTSPPIEQPSTTTISNNKTREYQTMVGNHQYLWAKVSGSTVDVKVLFANSTRAVYSYDFLSSFVGVSDGIKIQSFDPTNPGFVAVLTQIRDYLAYLAGPAQYDRLLDGTGVLHAELNAVIMQFDEILKKSAGKITANCLLMTDDQTFPPIQLSGGTRSNLGQYSDKITKVWIRGGYELVLINNENFRTEDAQLVTAHGNGKTVASDAAANLESLSSDDTERTLLDRPEGKDKGRGFSLVGTDLAHHVGSLICRPSLND